jgi:CRP/FNR family cyclic AMP-dependent transcriptional regulator
LSNGTPKESAQRSARDAACLARERERRRFAAGTELPDDGTVPLLLAGSARLLAATPLGPHPVATLHAPALVELRRATGGAPDLARVLLEPGSEAVLFPSSEANALLFGEAEAGQAFRRLALEGVAGAIRETNASIKGFFDAFASSEKAGRDSGEYQVITPATLDPARVYDLFDAAGLNPSGLPDLGLVARSLPAEGVLMRTGAAGDEAYLLAEGRLRVSMRIPGVGEEALAILAPGEIVGEMALIDDEPRSADVRAHGGGALVYALSRAVFRRLLETGDPAGAPLLAGIALALGKRHEEAIRKAAAFRVLAGF